VSRTLKTDIPGTDWRASLGDLESHGPRELFGAETPPRLVLDVGFGRGEFLTALAEKDPGFAFLGIEYSRKRVLKMARRLARTQLCNVRLVEAPAERVFERAIPAASVHRCWINFPDPWPKKRHHRRRLVQPAFVRDLARALEPEGLVEVATDHPEYAAWIDEIFSDEPALENCRGAGWSSDVEDRPCTAYEAEWRAERRTLHFFSFARRPDVVAPPL
jgi:tRNA (guanine-N7-)-methyltransferase